MSLNIAYCLQVHDAILKEYMGTKFEVYVPSNAPIGLHFLAYSPDKQLYEKAYGEKVRCALLRLC